MSFRSAIPDFSLANSLYIGATVTFWGVDLNGDRTNTLPLLYAGPTGAETVSNPQVLDGEGKFSFPVYHTVPLIAEVRDVTGGSATTGIIMPAASWAGAWQAQTTYQVNAFVQDPVELSIYAVTQSYVSAGSIATDIANGNLSLVFLGEWMAVASNAAAQAVAAAATAVAAAAAAQAAIIITPTGAGAVQRTIQNKALDDATVPDYTTLQQAIAARKNVTARAGDQIQITGVQLSNSESFDGRNTAAKALAGVSMFVMANYAPVIERLYISENLLSTLCAIKIGASRYAQLRDIYSPNTGKGGVELKPSTGYAALADFYALMFEGLDPLGAGSAIGISIGSSVNEIRATHVYVSGKLDYDGGGLSRPKANTIGWRQNTTVVSGLAVGGHQVSLANMIAVETGWWLTDAQLTEFTNVIADSTRGYGVILDGTCDKITFRGLFVGVSQGILVKDNCLNILFDGLNIWSIGTIPSWGQNPFFSAAGPYFAVTLQGNAEVTINGNNWKGDKRVSVASTAKLTVTGGFWFHGRNSSDIAAGATVYLAEKEYASFGDAVFRVPHDGYLFAVKVNGNIAPGAGKNVTFTVQVNGADTAMTAALSGDNTSPSAFKAKSYGPVFVTEGQFVTLKAAKDAGAATAGRYNFDVQMLGV